jgi:NAD(P)-dependent dehydrogenase (short-subunit alcohol dehydrogenase family)
MTISDAESLEPFELASFGSQLNVAVLGASGGIGGALADQLAKSPAVTQVFRLSRTPVDDESGAWLPFDLEDEDTIADASGVLKQTAGALNLVIVATGLLHQAKELQPEKTWRSLNSLSLERAFRINAVGPALVAKHFLPLLATDRKTAFAAISARVGSIEDNHFGGWYAYRSAKAALNMLLKTLSIELARRNPYALCVGLHPGTVDTNLSRPFQGSVPEGKLFPPARSARCLLSVLNRLTPDDTGGFFAWDGSRIPY